MMYRTQKRTHGKHPGLIIPALFACSAACAWNYATMYPLILVPVAAVSIVVCVCGYVGLNVG